MIAFGPSETIPLLRGRSLVDGRPAVYVCERFACAPPVTDPAAHSLGGAPRPGLEAASRRPSTRSHGAAARAHYDTAGGAARSPPRGADGGGACRAGGGAWVDRHFQPEGLHPPNQALPGRLPLLHLRPGTATGRESLHDHRRGRRAGARRRARGLPRGPVHPGRQAGAALSGGPRRARRARLRLDPRVPSRGRRRGARGDCRCFHTSTRASWEPRTSRVCARSRPRWG